VTAAVAAWADVPYSPAIGRATETDAARALTPFRAPALGRATETDLARTVGTPSAPPLGLATETDTARALSPTHAAPVSRTTETDTARPLTVGAGGGVSIGRATETDVARAFRLTVTHLAWDGGLGIAFSSNGGEFDPAYVAPPVPLATRVIVAQAIDSVAQDGVQFTPSVRVAEDGYRALPDRRGREGRHLLPRRPDPDAHLRARVAAALRLGADHLPPDPRRLRATRPRLPVVAAQVRPGQDPARRLRRHRRGHRLRGVHLRLPAPGPHLDLHPRW
jgi:hypothetical protein